MSITEPTVNAGYDQFNIAFPDGRGPIVEQMSGGRGERVRLSHITASMRLGDRVRLSGSGLLMKKDGSDGRAVRSYVFFAPSDVPQDLLADGLAKMQAAAVEHAQAAAALTLADLR